MSQACMESSIHPAACRNMCASAGQMQTKQVKERRKEGEANGRAGIKVIQYRIISWQGKSGSGEC